MSAVPALLTTAGIFIVAILGSLVHPAMAWVIIHSTSIWAGIDASKIQLHKYKVGGPTSTMTTVLGCLLLWVVVFPWYLINKGRIQRGAAQLKAEYAGAVSGE